MSLTRKATLVFLLIMGIAIFVRFLGLGEESLWSDEFFSLKISRGGASDIIINAARNDTHPPLYYILLGLWSRGFGASEWGLRSFSALIGVLSVALVFFTAKHLAGVKAGLFSSLVFALAPFHVYYSQEARMYALLVFVTVGCMLFAARVLASRRWYDWLGLVIFEGATLYTHNYGLFVIVTLNIYMAYLIFLRREDAEIMKPWLLAQIIVLGLYSPWIPVLIRQIKAGGASPYATSYVYLGNIINTFGSFFLMQFPWHQYQRILTYLIALGMIFGIFSFRRTEKEYLISIGKDQKHLLVIGFAVVSVALVFIAGKFMRIYNDRSLIIFLASFCIVLGIGMNKFRVVVQAIVIACYVLVSGASIYSLYTYPQKEQWREAAVYINNNAKSGDVAVVCTGFMKNVFRHYAGEQLMTVGIDRSLSGENLRSSLRSILSRNRRVWLVLSHEGESPIKAYLLEEKETCLMQHVALRGIDISVIQNGRGG